MIMCNVQGVTYDKHIENYHETLQFNIQIYKASVIFHGFVLVVHLTDSVPNSRHIDKLATSW